MHATDQCDLVSFVTAIQKGLGKLGALAETLAQLHEYGEESAGSGMAALNLLKFYTVCERILILIDREASGNLAPRVDWHSRLLLESSTPLPGMRPAIISTTSCKLLQKLLAFRNLKRNIYGYVPAPYVIEKLSELVIEHQPQLADEIQRFLSSFLRQRPQSATARSQRVRFHPQLAVSGSFSQMPKTLPSGS
ncbi:MAG: hypothetical protein ACREOO_02605 [bacterium]